MGLFGMIGKGAYFRGKWRIFVWGKEMLKGNGVLKGVKMGYRIIWIRWSERIFEQL